ncbi:MAG: hypothetical protein ABR520_00460 [Mycobacteriales bacterium]|nr:hypothetical protein [Frankia sp.]
MTHTPEVPPTKAPDAGFGAVVVGASLFTVAAVLGISALAGGDSKANAPKVPHTAAEALLAPAAISASWSPVPVSSPKAPSHSFCHGRMRTDAGIRDYAVRPVTNAARTQGVVHEVYQYTDANAAFAEYRDVFAKCTKYSTDTSGGVRATITITTRVAQPNMLIADLAFTVEGETRRNRILVHKRAPFLDLVTIAANAGAETDKLSAHMRELLEATG